MKLKEVVIWFIGALTLLYSVTEIGVALWFSSYALLSDGFHNLSDVFSLYITYWASKASRRARSDQMSYGWARTEILGALTNGIFLLSLCLYTTLEVIPELVDPEPEESGWYFIGVAAAGLALNTMATVLLCLTGQAHAHSHAGGAHGHSHGGSHGHDEKKKKHGHSEEEGHSHANKKHKHGHSEEEGHSHAHKKKQKKQTSEHELLLVNDDHHDHDSVKDTHSHSHSHSGDHPHKKKKKKKDLNMRATIIHFFGDMISSFFVLVAGILIEFGGTGKWVDYIDPVTSLVICLLILVTTLPLVRSCFNILLQKTPSSINLNETRDIINKLPGVLNVHDFHVWQLTDGMIITSLHIMCADGCDFAELSKKIKKVLHKRGIHSPTIQPEFVPSVSRVDTDSCLENCVEDCKEDWCCKTDNPPDQRRSASL